MAQTNTPAFRIALTVAALWMAGSAAIGVKEYRSAGADFNWPESFACTTPASYFIDPQCIADEKNRDAAFDEFKQHIAFKAAWHGIIPPVVLLLVVAYWTGIVGLSRRYARWIKTGSGKEEDQPASEMDART